MGYGRISGELFGNLACQLAIFGIRPVELLPVAVLVFAAIHEGAQGLGIFLREPGGRGRGGRADDSEDVVLRGCGDCVIQPVEIVAAFFRLHAAPGKFTHTHHVNARLLHERKIGFPSGFRPLLGIPGGAKQDGRNGRGLRMDEGSCKKQKKESQKYTGLQKSLHADLPLDS